MDIKAVIENYETALAQQIAEVVGVDVKNIAAKWDAKTPSVKIRFVANTQVTYYNFGYDTESRNISMSGYALNYITTDNIIVGVQSQPVGIDYNTFSAIANVFNTLATEDDTAEKEAE